MGPSSRRRVKSHGSLRFLVVTVSTSKYARKLQGDKINDESGDAAERIVRAAGGTVASRALISDDAQMLEERAKEFLMYKNDVALLTHEHFL